MSSPKDFFQEIGTQVPKRVTLRKIRDEWPPGHMLQNELNCDDL